MTQLQTISHNHMSLGCSCGHRRLVLVKELIERLSPTTTVSEVARRAKCLHCGNEGVSDFRLLYVCDKKEDFS